eukprot:212537-Amphidinium_carterae.1
MHTFVTPEPRISFVEHAKRPLQGTNTDHQPQGQPTTWQTNVFENSSSYPKLKQTFLLPLCPTKAHLMKSNPVAVNAEFIDLQVVVPSESYMQTGF